MHSYGSLCVAECHASRCWCDTTCRSNGRLLTSRAVYFRKRNRAKVPNRSRSASRDLRRGSSGQPPLIRRVRRQTSFRRATSAAHIHLVCSQPDPRSKAKAESPARRSALEQTYARVRQPDVDLDHERWRDKRSDKFPFPLTATKAG